MNSSDVDWQGRLDWAAAFLVRNWEAIAASLVAAIIFAVLAWMFRRRPPADPVPSPDPAFAIAPPPPTFTGRKKDMKAIIKALKPGKQVAITAVAGMGGIGKTATARKVAHDLHRQGRFADGGCEVNLRGYDPEGQRMDALEALRVLMPGAQGELAELQAQWRAKTAGKDMLILLDNARNDELIEALTPAQGPTVLVTTRETGFTGAQELAPLTPKEAAALIADLAPRVPKGARAEIATLGFHLPLVIDVIAREVERLSSLPVEEALAPFREISRLGEAQSRERGETIAAIFGHSITALPEADRMDYAALSLFVGGFFEVPVADLWEIESGAARKRLADWAARGLVQPVKDGEDVELGARWRMHDLLVEAGRRYLDAGEAAAIKRQWVKVALKLLTAADARYRDGALPGLTLIDRERATIEAAQSYAVSRWEAERGAGLDDLALAVSYFPNYSIFKVRRTPPDNLRRLDSALTAARARKDRDVEGRVLSNIGLFARLTGEFDKARDALKTSIASMRERNDRLGEALNECSLGILLSAQSQPDLDEAEHAFRRSNRLLKKSLANRLGL